MGEKLWPVHRLGVFSSHPPTPAMIAVFLIAISLLANSTFAEVRPPDIGPRILTVLDLPNGYTIRRDIPTLNDRNDWEIVWINSFDHSIISLAVRWQSDKHALLERGSELRERVLREQPGNASPLTIGELSLVYGELPNNMGNFNSWTGLMYEGHWSIQVRAGSRQIAQDLIILAYQRFRKVLPGGGIGIPVNPPYRPTPLPGPPRYKVAVVSSYMRSIIDNEPDLLRTFAATREGVHYTLQPRNLDELASQLLKIGEWGVIANLEFFGHAILHGSTVPAIRFSKEQPSIYEADFIELRTNWPELASVFAPGAEITFFNCSLGTNRSFIWSAGLALLGKHGGFVKANRVGTEIGEALDANGNLYFVKISEPQAWSYYLQFAPDRIQSWEWLEIPGSGN